MDSKAIVFMILAGLMVPLARGDDRGGTIAKDKRALAGAQAYVGDWRGVGQPKRGSNQGAWTEESHWAWRFDAGRAQLVAQLEGDKFYTRLELQAGETPGEFVLLATADGADATAPRSVERFTGKKSGDDLVLSAETAAADRPARISLRLVAGGDRLLTLFEKRLADGVYARLAEVGATRRGSSFAKTALGGPECVVTGGLGTIAVEHKGQKYYVCCGGCRDLFLDDPEAVLAEYRQRKAEEKAEKK